MHKMFTLTSIIKIGLAKNGTGHWWLQRMTSLALIPLSYWLLVLLDYSFNAPYEQMLDWLSSPVNFLAMMLWISAVCYHAALGLQVVIEDYVSNQQIQKLSIVGVQITFLVLALASIWALIQIFIAG